MRGEIKVKLYVEVSDLNKMKKLIDHVSAHGRVPEGQLSEHQIPQYYLEPSPIRRETIEIIISHPDYNLLVVSGVNHKPTI